MKIEIKVPSMGESITEATIGEILKPSGSPVSIDDEVLELETDKVNQVLYAPESGTLNLSVSSGDTVTIGQVIGQIDTEVAAEKKEIPKEPPKPPSSEGVRETREQYIRQIQSGEKPPSAKAPTGERNETRTPMTRIRKVIAQRLVASQQNTAMLTTFNEVDMSTVINLRTKYKDAFTEKHGTKLGFMSFFVKACVYALREVPEVNSYIDGDDIVHREYYDIGIAVGTERGLVVPVVRNCDKLSFAEIEKAIADYAQKARRGGLSVDDLQGGGFTITNGGVYGSLLSTPILNPPQSGILGMHKIDKRAVVVEDQIVIKPMMYLALSYDHRVIDGKEAVTFLIRVKEYLEYPAQTLLLDTW